jgi:hypothetical protein
MRALAVHLAVGANDMRQKSQLLSQARSIVQAEYEFKSLTLDCVIERIKRRPQK